MKRKAKKTRVKPQVTFKVVKVRPKLPTDTYTTSDICERHGCTQRTIRRRTATQGFPQGERGMGKEYKYLVQAVHDWELIHMPWLHPQATKAGVAVSDEQEHWNDMTAVVRGEEARQRIEARTKPPEKPSPSHR